MSVTVPAAPAIPDTYVPTSTFGAQLIQAMGPWMTLHLAIVLDGLGVACDPLFSLVMDTGADGVLLQMLYPSSMLFPDPALYPGDSDYEPYLPGYGQLFNISPQPGQPGYGAPTCPAEDLPYPAQFVGVQIPVGTDDTTARSLVMAESGMNRGTDAAVIAAAKRTLTGTQTVFYYPRTFSDGSRNAGWAGIGVKGSECASLAATQAAVNAVKLGGVMMWFELVGWTIGAMETAETLVSTMESDFVSVGGMEGDVPGA